MTLVKLLKLVESEDEESAIVKQVVVGERDAVLSAEEHQSCIAKVKFANEAVGKCMKCGSVVGIRMQQLSVNKSPNDRGAQIHFR